MMVARTALLLLFVGVANAHMAMTIVKGGVTTIARGKKTVGDNYRFPNHRVPCHGTSPGASQLTLTVGETVGGRTTFGAGHNGGHCAWAVSTDDQKTWHKFDDETDCTDKSTAGQAHDFVVPKNLPAACATGCVLGWWWSPASSGTCEIYNNCWDGRWQCGVC